MPLEESAANTLNDVDVDTVTIPESATPYILLQRVKMQKWRDVCEYIPRGEKLYDEIYSNLALYELEARIRHDQIAERYVAQMKREFEAIRPYVPETTSRVLDIGCGIAGIDLIMSNALAPDLPEFNLLDKTEISDSVYYRFRDQGAYYNSLKVASDMMRANGVPPSRLNVLDAETTELSRACGGVDLCLSLFSWGFHYPIETYLEDVMEVLSKQGRVILDVRKETDNVDKHTRGMEALRRRFNRVTVVEENRKHRRTLLAEPVDQSDDNAGTA